MKPRVNLLLNASHPFPMKNRCRHCGKMELEFYRDYTNAPSFHNIRNARDRHESNRVMDWASDINSDYVRHVLSDFDTAHYYGHSVGFKSYNPKRYRTISDSNGRYPIESGYWIVICANCHKEVWAVATDNKKFLPENFNRKALRLKLPIQARPSTKWW
jgi:hypothetical protein